jgi:hypothetical protein
MYSSGIGPKLFNCSILQSFDSARAAIVYMKRRMVHFLEQIRYTYDYLIAKECLETRLAHSFTQVMNASLNAGYPKGNKTKKRRRK